MLYFLTSLNKRTRQMKRVTGFQSLELLRAEVCLLLAKGWDFEVIDMEDGAGGPIKWELPEVRLAARQIKGG